MLKYILIATAVLYTGVAITALGKLENISKFTAQSSPHIQTSCQH